MAVFEAERRCDTCHVPMMEGYYLEGDYFCSDTCAATKHHEAWKDLQIFGTHTLEENYWTDWEPYSTARGTYLEKVYMSLSDEERTRVHIDVAEEVFQNLAYYWENMLSLRQEKEKLQYTLKGFGTLTIKAENAKISWDFKLEKKFSKKPEELPVHLKDIYANEFGYLPYTMVPEETGYNYVDALATIVDMACRNIFLVYRDVTEKAFANFSRMREDWNGELETWMIKTSWEEDLKTKPLEKVKERYQAEYKHYKEFFESIYSVAESWS